MYFSLCLTTLALTPSKDGTCEQSLPEKSNSGTIVYFLVYMEGH